jgi:hypothetical protein
LGPGANDNAFIGNKIEWNDGHGIQAYRALHNVVLGGVVDRNGKTGARLVECQHSTVVGAVFRRNGRLAQDSPADDCHISQENCTGVVISGIATNSGRDDDDVSGYDSPAVAIRHEGGTDVSVTGNDLGGRTSAVAIATGARGSGSSQLLNVGVPGVQSVSGTRVSVGVADLDLADGASDSATFALDPTGPSATGVSYRLRLVSRDARTAARGAAESVLLVFRETGGAEVVLGPVENSIGAGFGTTPGSHRVSATVSADGTELVVGLENLTGGAAQVRLELA